MAEAAFLNESNISLLSRVLTLLGHTATSTFTLSFAKLRIVTLDCLHAVSQLKSVLSDSEWAGKHTFVISARLLPRNDAATRLSIS
jgi:hypothetical protein